MPEHLPEFSQCQQTRKSVFQEHSLQARQQISNGVFHKMPQQGSNQ